MGAAFIGLFFLACCAGDGACDCQVNGNGQLQVTDVILLVGQIIGEGMVPCPGLTDLASDGVDNVSDVVVLVGAIVGA